MSEHIDLKNKYIVGQLLKNASRTYQCKDKKTGQAYAVKEFSIRDMTPPQVAELEEQIKKIQGFNHYTVIQVIDIIKMNNSIYVIQEFVENSSICYMAGLMPEFMLRKYINILVQALIYTHSKQYIISNFTLNSVYTSKAGLLKIQFLTFQTKQILSPEEAAGQKLTLQTNIFNLGLIVYHMISGEEFELIGNQELMVKCEVDNLIEQMKCSEVMKEFMQQCLAKKPSDRITITNVVKEHVWIFNTDFQESQSKLAENKTQNPESDEIDGDDKDTNNQMHLNTSIQHLDSTSQGDDSNDDNMNFQTNVPVKKLVIRKQKMAPKPKTQLVKTTSQFESNSIIKSISINSNDIAITLNKSPTHSPNSQQKAEQMDDDDDVNITTSSAKKVVLSPRKKQVKPIKPRLASQTLNFQKQQPNRPGCSQKVELQTHCFTITESNEGMTQYITNSLRMLVNNTPDQDTKQHDNNSENNQDLDQKKQEQFHQIYQQQIDENEMKLKPQKTVNFLDVNVLDDDNLGFEAEPGPEVKLKIKNKRQHKKRNKSFSQQDDIDLDTEINNIVTQRLTKVDLIQDNMFNQLSLQNQGQYRSEFQQNWQVLQDISNDINVQQAELAIHNLSNLHYKSPESFMECFYKFYQTNFILNIFNKCKYCDQIEFKLIDFINQMQSDVDFAQKCQVVGYQNVLYNYLTSIKQKQIILTNQQVLINYIKVNTRYILRQEQEKKDLHNLFVIFVNNDGFRLMKTLIQITQYKQPQQSHEDFVFQYFTDNNVAIQQQLFALLKKAGQCFNQEQYIYMVLTQTNDVVNDNIIIQLFQVVSAMLRNFKSQTVSKNVQQLIFLAMARDYVGVLLNCVKFCISQENYQQKVILELINQCLKTLLSIELKEVDGALYQTQETIINNLILIISEVCQPRTEEIIATTWTVLKDTIGEMFTRLTSQSCITYLMIYLNQAFLDSSEERAVQFLSEKNFRRLLDITCDQNDVNIVNMAFTLLLKFLKQREHIQSLLRADSTHAVRLFKIGLQALIFPNHLWMHLGILCLLQVSQQRNATGECLIEQAELDDIEGIDPKELKSIEASLQKLQNLNYTTYFSNGLVLQALRQLFKETPVSIPRIANQAFLRNLFYTIKDKHADDENFLFTCLQLLESIFSDRAIQKNYWNKFEPMIQLFANHGSLKTADICQKMLKIEQEQ